LSEVTFFGWSLRMRQYTPRRAGAPPKGALAWCPCWREVARSRWRGRRAGAVAWGALARCPRWRGRTGRAGAAAALAHLTAPRWRDHRAGAPHRRAGATTALARFTAALARPPRWRGRTAALARVPALAAHFARQRAKGGSLMVYRNFIRVARLRDSVSDCRLRASLERSTSSRPSYRAVPEQ
jgi:hypothetical protein